MAKPSEPPPGKTFLAAAAGGFGGAIVGAVAATSLMGDAAKDNPGNGAVQPAEPQQQEEVMVAEQRQER